MSIALRAAALLLALVFAWAALAKVVQPGRWRDALSRYSLPVALRVAALILTPLAELVVVALIVGGQSRAAGALVVALIAMFCIALLRARQLQGDRVPCGCFGRTTERDYRLLLLRNAVLAAPAVLLMRARANVVLFEGFAFEPTDVLPAILVGVGLGVALWTMLQASHSLKRRDP